MGQWDIGTFFKKFIIMPKILKAKSPAELLQEIAGKYGDDAVSKMPPTEAQEMLNQAIEWSSEHDLPCQDYLAIHCRDISNWYEGNDSASAISLLIEGLTEMANHLQRGAELKLSELEQRTIDTLWSWVPHDYPESYVACARKLAKKITALKPKKTEVRSEKGYDIYFNKVINELEKLTKTYGIDEDIAAAGGDYTVNLTIGYFHEWLQGEYGTFIHHSELGDYEC